MTIVRDQEEMTSEIDKNSRGTGIQEVEMDWLIQGPSHCWANPFTFRRLTSNVQFIQTEGALFPPN